MAYSADLRKRVMEFVEQGGTKSEAVRLCKVSRWCVNKWCKNKNLTPNYPKRRNRKLHWHLLKEDVLKNPDALLRERAVKFGVHPHAIWYAMKEMKLSRKKTLRYTQRKHQERIEFVRELREQIKKMVRKIIFI